MGKGIVKEREAGYTLVAVIFILFVMTIWLSVAMPKVIKQLQRDRELETVERGKQYIRAIQLYYRQFHNFPPSVDALVKTNNIRYLRKKYKDPTTGKDEWKIIRYGQAKTQTLGFFGMPLMGGSAFGGIGPIAGQNSSPFGGNPTDSTQQGQTDANNPNAGSTTLTDQSTQGQSTTQQNGIQSAFGNSASGQQSGSGLTGQTFGGGGIIGFSPNSPKPTLITYRKRNKFNEWEFIYDPALEQYYANGAAGAVGGGLNQNQSQGSGFGSLGYGSSINPTGTTGTGTSGNSSGTTNSGQSGSSVFQ